MLTAELRKCILSVDEGAVSAPFYDKNMNRYIIQTIHEDDGHCYGETLLVTTDAKVAEQARAALTTFAEQLNRVVAGRQSPPPPHAAAAGAQNITRSRPITIRAVDEAKTPFPFLKPDDTFVSAVSFSTEVLGYSYNAAVAALSTKRRLGILQATLKGITFCYSDDVQKIAEAEEAERRLAAQGALSAYDIPPTTSGAPV